ncbi:RuBisCO operon transcriptional regulator CbbR [hydrothermal vent metagenome]|uniref:RuBisCO operon transcriptional regulator CbbR n=1 Tax=hydrothermal vent metagenome TaxID=652676 RepID=A0A1W1BG18_9ZZZZ
MIYFNVKQLISFEAVIRLRSFTKAAKKLNLTQPAIYMQVKQLQERVGSDIFTIQGKEVFPTLIGAKVLKASKTIINSLELLSVDIEQTLSPETGHLNIAVATTANSFVSRVLAAFKKKYPKSSFHLEVTNRKSLLEKLEDFQLDFAIMGEPPKELLLESEIIMENPLIVIAHPKHKLVKQKNITLKDLKKEILITREQGSGTRMTIERITDLTFNSDIEINSNEAIVEAVQAGLGIGFVSKHTVRLELENNVIKQLNVINFPITRYWHIVSNQQIQLSPMAKQFKAFIHSFKLK